MQIRLLRSVKIAIIAGHWNVLVLVRLLLIADVIIVVTYGSSFFTILSFCSRLLEELRHSAIETERDGTPKQ